MDVPALSVEQQIKQLGDARKLVLSDANYYPQIIQGILPIVAPGARVELRRWVSDFLAEAFASPAIPPQQKQTMSLVVLQTLKNLIDNPQEDPTVVKCVVQTAASIYPHVFRWIINNSYDIPTWELMVAIKSKILRIWDSASPGVRICCIKFAQRVVMVQTESPDTDAKCNDPSEISLSMVTSNNVLDSKNLEAEASGLLDRVLSVFQETTNDAVLVDATLNSLSMLLRARPQLSSKILSVILNFNPLKQVIYPISLKTQVAVKSMEKTTRQLLLHILKRDPRLPLAGRIQQYVERMAKAKVELFDDINRKRSAPESIDIQDDSKRQRLSIAVKAASPSPILHVPPLDPGPHTIAELFTITTDASLKVFDVAMLPEDLVVKIGITILQRIEFETLNQAIEGIRQRYTSLSTSPTPQPDVSSVPPDIEEEDDYEPDFPVEDNEQILNKLDSTSEELKSPVADMALGHFTLPPPLPLSHEETAQGGHGTFSRVFSVMQTLDERGKKSKAGLNRMAASNYDRDAWITIITRLATRASTGLEDPDIIKQEVNTVSFSLSNLIRESLHAFILEDFRKRIDIAIAWLCEEWYNDMLQLKYVENAVLNYEKLTIRVLDGFLPYLDGQDRALVIKFLGDIPELSMEALSRITGLCRDPATINMALQSLLYLVAFRPPVRELVLDTVEEIWIKYEDARPMVVKLFAKWRPRLGEQLKGTVKEDRKPESVEIAVA